MMNMQVRLSAVGNPDFDESPDIGIPTKWVEVGNYAEASIACQDFLEEHVLGSGNWTGGQIRDGSDIVAQVSFNGRVWEGRTCVYTPGSPTDES